MNSRSGGHAERPVPHVLSRAWQRKDEVALEYFNLQSAPGLLLGSGQITSVMNEVPHLVNYTLVCDRTWVTREAHVHVNSGGTHSRTRLARSEDGVWQVDGEARRDLDGLTDVDIQWTPATNVLPINRLRLGVGESREVAAAWVRIPELRVERLSQTYTRVRENVYQYESGGGSFVAQIIVDESGFVERYADLWVCIGKA